MAYTPTEWKTGDIITDGLLNKMEQGIAGSQEKLHGTPGQLIGIDGDGAAKPTAYPYNPNLLIDWCFANPVNRNGLTEYTGNIYTIDGWRNNFTTTITTVKPDCIEIKSPQRSGSGWVFYQVLPDCGRYIGSTVTYSALVKSLSGNNPKYINFGMYNSGGSYLTGKSIVIPESGLVSLTYEIEREDVASVRAGFYFYNAVAASDSPDILEVIAAKLELGSVQTLAHQDEDGNWVLNEIPNYAEQYAICEQYSPITGEFVGSQHSNPNLLDNWHFADPINQRGQTEYTKNGYTLDRWMLVGGGQGIVTIDSNEGAVILSSSNGHSGLLNRLDIPVPTDLTVTLSALYKGTIALHRFGETYKESRIVRSESWDVASITYTIPAGTNFSTNTAAYSPSFYTSEVDNEKGYVMAMKLELGTVQTLAHKEGDEWVLNDPPPNKALELMKCQRYQTELSNISYPSPWYPFIGIGLANTVNTVRIMAFLPTTLRAKPTIICEGNWMVTKTSGTTAGNALAVDYISPKFSIGNNVITFTANILGGAAEVGQTYMMVSNSYASNEHLFLIDANL